MVLTLYKIDASPPVRAVLMTIEYLGLNVEKKDVNILVGEQFTPEFLKKNPAHRVPVLEDGDLTLADSHPIITYLVSKYGAELRSTLYPVDLRTRATVDHRLYLDATLLFPKNAAIVGPILSKKATGPNEEQIEAVIESYGFLERYLERSTFLAGEHITLADISAVSTVSSLNVFVPVDAEKFPKLNEWFGKLKEADWYQKANLPGLEQFENLVKPKN